MMLPILSAVLVAIAQCDDAAVPDNLADFDYVDTEKDTWGATNPKNMLPKDYQDYSWIDAKPLNDVFGADIFDPAKDHSEMVDSFSDGGDIVYDAPSSSLADYINNNKYKLWPDGQIPYTISYMYGERLGRKVIAKAMEELQSKTCIRFVPYNNQTHTDFLRIWTDGTCNSHLGRLYPDGKVQIAKTQAEQRLSLEQQCLTHGVVMHEFLHAIGLPHENSRSDRDDHIRINMDNVNDRNKDKFEKYTITQIDALGMDYDCGSLMHYRDTAYSTSETRDTEVKTIEPIDSNCQIGQRVGPSEMDVQKVNRLYDCPVPAETCRDMLGDCEFWGTSGFCDGDHSSFMESKCQKTCGSCEAI